MIKQEEIRKGILDIVGDNYVLLPKGITKEEWITDFILSYLHSQGVVIKVRKKKPLVDGTFEDFSRCGHPFNFHDGYYKARNDMLKAGYVATEPLIKEAINSILARKDSQLLAKRVDDKIMDILDEEVSSGKGV